MHVPLSLIGGELHAGNSFGDRALYWREVVQFGLIDDLKLQGWFTALSQCSVCSAQKDIFVAVSGNP